MRKRVLVTGLVCVGLGYGWGVNTTSQPPVQTQTRIVKVPEVQTRVIDKVITQTKPMPDSCKSAISILNEQMPNVSGTTAAAGAISLALSDAAIRVAFGESTKLKLLIDDLNEHKGDLSDAAVALSTANSQLQRLVAQCEIDVRK